MFDIGFFELVIVAIVGLVVIGPDRLPDTIRTVALWIGRLKRSLRDTRRELEEQLGADDIRRQLHNEEIMRSLNETKEEIQRTIDNPFGDHSNSHDSHHSTADSNGLQINETLTGSEDHAPLPDETDASLDASSELASTFEPESLSAENSTNTAVEHGEDIAVSARSPRNETEQAATSTTEANKP